MPVGILPSRGPGVMADVGGVFSDLLDEAIERFLSINDSIDPLAKQAIGVVNSARKIITIVVEGGPGPLDFLQAGPFVNVADPAKFARDVSDWLGYGLSFSPGGGLMMFSPRMGVDP